MSIHMKSIKKDNMDWTQIFALIGAGASFVGLIYMIIRNFKNDVNARIDRLEKHMDLMDERMFMLATGKNLADAIKETYTQKQV